MFEKSVLFNTIENAIRDDLGNYIDDVIQTMNEYTERGEDPTIDVGNQMLNNHTVRVSDTVIESFKITMPRVHMKLQTIAFMGGKEFELTSALYAGQLYAACFYAIKGKYAKEKDIVAMNDLHSGIIDQAFGELKQSFE